MTLVMVLGVFIGAIMGLTGAGGGILAVPVLVLGLPWTLQEAAPVALLAVASGAAVGALDGFRHRLVRYRAGMLMAVCGWPMTRVGQDWARVTPQAYLLGAFALLMLVVAWRFFQQSRQTVAHGDDALRIAHIHTHSGRFIWTPLTALLLAGIGTLTGLLTGLLGVGGGFLIVPLMRRFTHLAIPGIVATSLFVISLVSGGGVVSALLAGGHLPMPESAGFMASMVAGMLLGRRVSRQLSPAHVQRGFALLLACVSVYLLTRALQA